MIISDMGWGESGWEDGPRGDWRDCSVGMWVITSGWKVAESAERCEGIVESGTVTVVHQKLSCKPNWKNGRHESFGLVKDGEFVNNKEDGVHIGHRDCCVVNEGRNGIDLGEVDRRG